MRIWNPTTSSYEQFIGDAFTEALALKTNLSEFTYATYTPTIAQSGTRTTSGITARYIQVGRFVHAQGDLTITQAGSSGSAITMTLPVDAANGNMWGLVMYNDAGTALYQAHVLSVNASTCQFYETNTTNGNPIGVTPAIATANGDTIRWNLMYESAS